MKFSPWMPKLSKEKKIRIAREKIRKILKIREVIAIIMFGSQVTGKARPDSDVDLAAITKISNEKIRLKVMKQSDEIVQVSHFNTLPLEIQFRVIKEGKVMACKNEEELQHHIKNTILHYLDFQPVLHRFYRGVLENV